MAFQQWLDLFGRSTDDQELRDALAKKGIAADALEVEKDDISVMVDLNSEGVTLVLTDEAYLHKRDDMRIGEGAPILSEFTLWVAGTEDVSAYGGPLPLGLKQDASRASLRKRFGDPSECDDDPPSDQWTVDDLVLIVEYDEDESGISVVALQMPD